MQAKKIVKKYAPLKNPLPPHDGHFVSHPRYPTQLGIFVGGNGPYPIPFFMFGNS